MRPGCVSYSPTSLAPSAAEPGPTPCWWSSTAPRRSQLADELGEVVWSFTLDSQLSLRAPVATREEHATGPITADEVIEVHRLLSGDAPLGELLYGHAS